MFESTIVLRADIKPIVDGEAARCAASPSISVLTYLRIAIDGTPERFDPLTSPRSAPPTLRKKGT